MWKKIEKGITLCVAALLVIVVTVSGTQAFESLSAWEWAQQAKQEGQTVSVSIVQQQRAYDADGNTLGLIPWDSDSQLVPLATSAQYSGTNFDQYGMPVADGYFDQITTLKNTGTVDAYVRLIVAIPAALDDPNDAGHNALHWNLGNRFLADGSFTANNSRNTAYDDITWQFTETASVYGTTCNLYIFTYNTPLKCGKTTLAAAITGFYLDKAVNVVDGHILLDGIDTGFTDEGIPVYFKAQAVQTYGFDSAESAFAHAQMPKNPWHVE